MRPKPKSATEKDVRYAMEFGGERLVLTTDPTRRPANQYHLQPSGTPVAPDIAIRFNVEDASHA